MNTQERIEQALAEAVEKHPKFADNLHHAVSILMEEVGEVAQAINDGDYGAAIDEAAQVCAVCIRLIRSIDIGQNDGDHQGWILFDEFDKEPNEGWCWIFYKGRVKEAYRDHTGAFKFNPYSRNCYVSECITHAKPIHAPGAPV